VIRGFGLDDPDLAAQRHQEVASPLNGNGFPCASSTSSRLTMSGPSEMA